VSSLTVLQDKPKVRPSRSSKWRAGVLVAVHLVIAAHIAHWLAAGRTLTPVEPSEAMAFAKGGMINAGLIFFAATILLTAVFGRFFCGWACHVVALQDLSRWLLAKVGLRPKPLRSRLLRLVPLLAFAYMFLWPVAYRLWIGDSFGRFGTELTTTEFWSTFPGWVIGGLTFAVCGFAAVYFLGAKGFCTYACPYGAVFGVAERLSPLRIRVTDACQGCAHCTSVCTSNVRVHEEVRDYGMVVDPGCMKCLDCVSVCPNDALYYGVGPLPLLARRRAWGKRLGAALSWGEEAVLGVAFAAAFFTFRGLYGRVPFLMALGLAGVLAYGALLGWRLLRRRDLAWKHHQLKRRGRLRPAGVALAAALGGVGLFWGHSAFVRYQAFAGEGLYGRTEGLRRATPAAPERPAPLSAAERALARGAVAHLERVRDWGLVPTAGNAARLAWLYWLLGSSPQLEAAAHDALARGEERYEMERLLGRDAWLRGDLARAVAAYEGAIAARPEEAAPYVELGVALARGGRLDAAREVFDRGRRRVGDSPDLDYNTGLVAALQGNSTEAIALFEAALALDPAHRPARENLAGVLAAAGRFDESVAQYRAALEQAPEDLETRLLLARALAEGGRLEAAAAEAREVLSRSPDDRRAAGLLAEVEARQRGGGEERGGRDDGTAGRQRSGDGARR
jgi:tetratricopeptide (TPR) repeat protein/NAD-dependent dihydropyrimidine dehydrogenase PreA subunit